jgi:hypothetical protein
MKLDTDTSGYTPAQRKAWNAKRRTIEGKRVYVDNVTPFPKVDKPYTPGPAPVTKTVITKQTTRPGQAAFRRAILKRDGACIVTGTPVGSFLYSKGKRRSLIHAAHIVPVIKCKDDEYWDIDNGMTMRADIHQAFDSALFTIGSNKQILTSRFVDPDYYPSFLDVFFEMTPKMSEYISRHREWAFKQWNRWAFS